jgi:hypothetical protein
MNARRPWIFRKSHTRTREDLSALPPGSRTPLWHNLSVLSFSIADNAALPV